MLQFLGRGPGLWFRVFAVPVDLARKEALQRDLVEKGYIG